MAAGWCRSSRADRQGRLSRLVWWCRSGPRWRTSEGVTDSLTVLRCLMGHVWTGDRDRSADFGGTAVSTTAVTPPLVALPVRVGVPQGSSLGVDGHWQP